MEGKNQYKRNTFHVEIGLSEKLKDIAFWDRKSLKEVINEAFRSYISKCERRKGSPYLARERNRKGRGFD